MKTLATITICTLLCASMAEPVQAASDKERRVDQLINRQAGYLYRNRSLRSDLNVLRFNLLSNKPLYYNSRATRLWRSKNVSRGTDAPFMKCTNYGKKVTCK